MLDAQEKRPLYAQLVDALLDLIANEYAPDDKLPTEKDLCDEYAVSRTTVRQALAELERRGNIYRIQGKGSFVASEAAEEPDSLFSFDFISQCETTTSEHVVRELIDVDSPDVSMAMVQMFGGASRGSVQRVDARYKLGEHTIALETIYLRRVDAQGLSWGSNLGHVSFAHIRERIASVREKYQARKLYPSEEELTAGSDGSILAVTRFVSGSGGELLALIERRVATDYLSYQNYAFSS